MTDCEVVTNVAYGKEFQYCRTHKVESKDCPQSAGEEIPFSVGFINKEAVFEIAPKFQAQTKTFKVGDKVLVKSGQSCISHLLHGRICTVLYISPSPGSHEFVRLEDETGFCGVVRCSELEPLNV